MNAHRRRRRTAQPAPCAFARPCAHVHAAAGQGGSESKLQETAALDELIDILLVSSSQEQLAQTVAENALSFDQKFWLRLAARTDTADEDAQQQLKSLANTVMQIVDAMVQKTDEKLSG